MKLIACEQRGAEWFQIRLGKPSASSFADIITRAGKPKTGISPRRYMLELLGERLTGFPTQHFETEAMRRGIELEPRARAWWEFNHECEALQVGFALSDCERWGCSPDGLVGDEGGVEIKCPMVATFLEVATSGKIPDEHYIQVQSSLWITGRAWWDYVLFTDVRGLNPIVTRCLPDLELHAAMKDALTKFCDDLDAMERDMRAAGHGYTAPIQDDGDPMAGCPFD